MPTHSVILHSNGPALWPEAKPLEEVLALRDLTPELIWSATYQGAPTPPTGYTFKRDWWNGGRNRFHLSSPDYRPIGRYIGWDGAFKEKEQNDRSACTVWDILPSYQMALIYAEGRRVTFPDFVAWIMETAERFNQDKLLNGVIIEDAASGTSAIQTIARQGADWLRPLIIPFVPTTDKVTRANQSAVWCKVDGILLPHPEPGLYWLKDYEDEMFGFPQWGHDDLVDASSEVIIYCENYLELFYHSQKKDGKK